MQDSPITATVDFHRDGVQHGFLKLPHSHDDSAWGSLMIPITVVRNGDGPTALLTGGNHGDEYEGITALLKLSGRLRAEDIRGRVIIVPMMNHPAVLNGTRTSPLDKGNLNRAFPGSPTGTLTQRIADYFTRYLVPLCDLALEQGVDNVLRWAGILPGEPRMSPTRMLEIPDSAHYLQSEHAGLLEFAVNLGEPVKAGAVMARVYSMERTGAEPAEYRAPVDGLLIGRRHPAKVAMGDTFAVLAVPL